MIELIIALVVIGAALYLVKLIPMDPTIRTVLTVVVIVAVVIWILRSFGPAVGLS